ELAAAGATSPAPPRRRVRPRPGRLTAAGALALGLAVTLVVLLFPGGHGSLPAPVAAVTRYAETVPPPHRPRPGPGAPARTGPGRAGRAGAGRSPGHGDSKRASHRGQDLAPGRHRGRGGDIRAAFPDATQGARHVRWWHGLGGAGREPQPVLHQRPHIRA